MVGCGLDGFEVAVTPFLDILEDGDPPPSGGESDGHGGVTPFLDILEDGDISCL